MTIEERLKDLIIERYGTMKDFSVAAQLPYGTVDTILRRGVNKASITNIIAICKTLNISTDELAKGKIVPIEPKPQIHKQVLDLESALSYMRNNYEDNEDLSIDGKVLSDDELDSFYFAIATFIRFVKRKRENEQ